MRFYVLLEAPKGLSKNKQLAKIINDSEDLLAFKAEGIQETLYTDVAEYRDRVAKKPKAGNEYYIIDADFNGKIGQGLAKANHIAKGAFILNLKLEKINSIGVVKPKEIDNDLSNDSEGYSTWQKVAMAAGATLTVAAGLFVFGAIPAAAAAVIATKVGVSALVAEMLVSFTAAAAGLGALATVGLVLQAGYNWAFGEKVLNEKEYKAAVTEENEAVSKLMKKLKGAKGTQLNKTFAALVKTAPAREFNEDGTPKAEDELKADKLVVRQWEHKKLDQLFAIEDKKAFAQKQDKILQKAKVKFKNPA